MSNCDHSSELPHKGMLFINDDGYSLHFVIRIRDVREQDNLVKKLKVQKISPFQSCYETFPL